jgi:hypothetical protein
METLYDKILKLNFSEDSLTDQNIKYFGLLCNTSEMIKTQLLEIQRSSKVDITSLQNILISWGKWSNSFSRTVRQKIKESDLFVDDDHQRFISRRFNLIYLYCTKCSSYFELLSQMNPIKNAARIYSILEEIKEIKTAFINQKEEALPKWVKL